MTEKRFTIWELNNAQIEDNVELESYICLNERESEEMCELLNELHEKNNELRLQLNLCSDQRNEFHRGARENANRVGKLEKENEQLKHRINDYNIALKKLQDLTERKINENEQLKHKLKSLNDNFNHLKRLFDEIEEPISDELLAEYSRIVGEDLND